MTGSLVPAALLVFTGYCTVVHTALVGMTFAVGISGLQYPGYAANVLDVAPNNADLAYGISNTLATIPGIAGTLLSGLLLSNSTNPARDWRRRNSRHHHEP